MHMRIELNEIIDSAKKHGFTAAVELFTNTIQLLPEVRDMCSADKCHMYQKNWACPPGCGTLEECAANIGKYASGIIVQTIGHLEDSMDFENMQETQVKHDLLFKSFADFLRKDCWILPLGAGTCQICSTCTYPNASCRFPDKMTSSMEAYGMLVSQICKDNRLPYYYGKNTIAYTSCYLIEEL